MKKYLLWLLLIFVVCSSAIYNLKNTTKQQTVNKDISFSIYKSINYTANVYNNTSAQLQITIEKVSNNNHHIVWNKSYNSKLLREYPAPDSAFTQTITVPGINSSDHFCVSYIRTYNSNGSTLQIQNAAIIYQSSGSRIDIRI